MSSSTPPLAVELRPSRLYAAGLLALAAGVVIAAPLSNLALPLKILLVVVALAALGFAWRDARVAGLRELRIEEDASGQRIVVARYADGRQQRAAGAGHAWLGTLAIFVFVERADWRRYLGPQRLCVLRDAVDAEAFRRLRVRLALG